MSPSLDVGAVSRPRSSSAATTQRRTPISTTSDWTFDLIRELDHEIGLLAEEYGLDTYPNQIEIIRSDQMMDAYASVGMPIGYHHWSYGKQFVSVEQQYQHGMMGLAYEIVINSNPCIAYLMEENTFTMQALVIAHACYGHNSFFKGNYLFRTWTDAGSIIDYLVFARNYIAECEQRHGVREVEALLDACHALMNYGVDRYKRPRPISAEEEKRRKATLVAGVQVCPSRDHLSKEGWTLLLRISYFRAVPFETSPEGEKKRGGGVFINPR